MTSKRRIALTDSMHCWIYALLEEIYADKTEKCFSGLGKEELALINVDENGGEAAHVYGDTDVDLVSHLVEIVLGRPLSADDMFVDLGSGSGRLLLQMLLLTNVRRVCGIELSPTRHSQAAAALNEARTHFAPLLDPSRIQLYCASMLKHVAVAESNLLYCYSLALSDDFLASLRDDLALRLGALVLLRGKGFHDADGSSMGADSSGGRLAQSRRLQPVLVTQIVNRVHQYFGYRVVEAGGSPADSVQVLLLEQSSVALGPIERPVFTSPEDDDTSGCNAMMQDLLEGDRLL